MTVVLSMCVCVCVCTVSVCVHTYVSEYVQKMVMISLLPGSNMEQLGVKICMKERYLNKT